MKNVYIFLVILLSNNAYFSQESEPRIYSSFDGFDPLPTAYLFGDDVKLRTEPNSNAEIIELLPIGTKIEILEKTNKSMTFNGLESFWCKVKVGDQQGFLLQGLISLEKLSYEKTSYYFSLARKDELLHLKVRYLINDSSYVESEYPLYTEAFQLHVSDNRGFESIQHILTIDLFAEACGIDGGGYYLFFDSNGLHQALDYSQVGDGGVFWFNEDLIFPADENGVSGKVVYTRAYGTVVEDDETFWTDEKITKREFTWQKGALFPSITDFQKRLSEDESD